jgi:PAS domain S-box-containing protein
VSWGKKKKTSNGDSTYKAEHLYRTLFEQSPDGVLIIDAATALPIEFNDVACQQLGYNRKEFAALRISDYEAAESPEATGAHIEKVLAEGTDVFETLHRTKDGEILNVLVIAHTVDFSDRRAFHCIFRDVTERKLAEKRLRDALTETRQRSAETAALLTASRAVLEFQDFAGAARSIFDACKNLIGASSGYIALLSGDELENEVLFLDSGGLACTVDESLPMPVRGLRGEVYRSGTPAYENDFMSSDWFKFMPSGHVRLENVLFAPLLIKGKTVGLLGIANKPGGFNDNDLLLASAFCDLVSAALYNDRTFESLELSEERFRSFVEQSSDGIVIIDNTGDIIEWNRGQTEITGISPEDALGKPLWDIQFELIPAERHTPEAHDRLKKMIGEFLVTKKPFWTNSVIETEIQRADGSHGFIQTITFPIDTNSDFMAASIIRDVTRRKQSEELSAALNDINAAMSSTLDLDEVMNRVVAESVRSLKCDSAAIFLKENDHWTLRSQYGLHDGMTGERFSNDEAPAMVIAAKERRPVFVGDVETDNRVELSSGERDAGVRSFLAVPLVIREEVMGVITFNHHAAPSTFSGEQVDFANNLASSVSLAIENASLYQKELDNRAMIQSHANQLAVLHQIGLSLNKETDKHRLLKMVLKNAAELTLAGVGAMILVREGKTELVSMYYAPWYDGRCEITEDASTLHRRIAQFVDNEADAARINDLGSLPRPLAMPEGHLHLQGLLIGTLRDTRGAIMGHFLLSNKAGKERFTSQDEEIITLLATQSSVALVSAENFEREHHVAETLQSALLPQAPIRDDMEVGLLYRSSGSFGKVGGDFYDFIELDGNKIAIAVGDVCGKGLTAATYTAMIKYMLRAYLEEGLFPGDCLTRLNRAVHKQVTIEKFVTMGLALIDIEHQLITYSSAGHPPTLVYRNGRASPLLSRTAVPLGVLPDYQYMSTQEPTSRGSNILMYTDGLIEARPEAGEPFGLERLTAELVNASTLPAQDVADRLIAAALAYSGGPLRDDIALLVVKLTQSDSESRPQKD